MVFGYLHENLYDITERIFGKYLPENLEPLLSPALPQPFPEYLANICKLHQKMQILKIFGRKSVGTTLSHIPLLLSKQGESLRPAIIRSIHAFLSTIIHRRANCKTKPPLFQIHCLVGHSLSSMFFQSPIHSGKHSSNGPWQL